MLRNGERIERGDQIWEENAFTYVDTSIGKIADNQTMPCVIRPYNAIDQFDNGLSADEAERLAMLSEECGEVISIIGKINRHGYESHNPSDSTYADNREELTKELADCLYAIEFVTRNDLSYTQRNKFIRKRREQVSRYTHHQRPEQFPTFTSWIPIEEK